MAKKVENRNNNSVEKLGKKLKALRIAKGYTNADFFAYEHNISRSQYSRYEVGQNVRFNTLIKLLEIHNLSLKEFFSEGFE